MKRTYIVYDYYGIRHLIEAANLAHAKRLAAKQWGLNCNVYLK